jgi:signal transduction histidine kinase
MKEDCLQGGSTTPDTYFASPERATSERIRELSELALADPILEIVFEAVGGYTLVIDQHRQIIAANDELLQMLGAKRNEPLLELRIGEALNCINVARGPNGCGTSRQCRHCGAVAAILAAQVSNQPVDGTCTVACCDDDQVKPTELRVRVKPLLLANEQVYVFVFHDITVAKQRELLEQVFLHELRNLVTGLLGWSDALNRETVSEAATQIVELARRTGECLEQQGVLLNAESGQLQLKVESINLEAIVASLRALFGTSEYTRDRCLLVDVEESPKTLITDGQLLLRVLGNLVKNAFEATPTGGAVTLRIISSVEGVVFEVHNLGALPVDVAKQLFKRRVTTKGPGRGLGLYSVQLFGEQCLGGQVTFESTDDCGTIFRLNLPNCKVTAAPPSPN